MDNSEKYDMLADGNTGVPSNIGIVPSDSFTFITSDSIKQSLCGSTDFQVITFEEDDDNTILVTINHRGENIPIEIYINPMSRIDINEFGFANQISENDLNTASRQSIFIEVSLFFGTDILDSFHLQLKILHALVPNACVVIDFMSYRLLSAQWLRMAVNSPVAPSPNYLYTIHGVYDENSTEKRYWFHTHGLLRCGSVEFEILNITEGAQQMNDLIVHVVKRILKNPPMEKEKFQIGYDGMGINLAWVRWEEALKDFPEGILGGMDDRQDDNAHTNPSGILFAVEDNHFISPQIYAKALSENPIYYISNEETLRMSGLANERFFCFKDAFEKYGAKSKKKSFFKKVFKKNDSDVQPWSFLVKLGLAVDNSKAETEREHLWFNVISIDEKYIEGELLNQPYWISSLKEGDVNKFPVDLLTDWIIYSPDNTYTTDSIYELGYFK